MALVRHRALWQFASPISRWVVVLDIRCLLTLLTFRINFHAECNRQRPNR